MPKKTVKAVARRNTLFSRNADSRERIESSTPSARSRSIRQARSEKGATRTTARKARKNHPIEPWVKAWTDPMMPERVRNVPKMVRPKVRMTSDRFQSFSMPRRSWIITECRNAVPVSQGMKAAFSTGSHAQ